jgi:hypothetical protein
VQADYPGQQESNIEHGWAALRWLECGVENCKSPVPVFVHKNDSTTPEDNQQESGTSNTSQPIPALLCRDFHPVAEEKVRDLLTHLP